MATYNGEKFLREQIDSILNQSYKDWELIICDDCSTDSTIDILKEYAGNNDKIKIYINEKNLGFKRNFEKNISLCSGEFIAMADQDDIWEPYHLQLLHENIHWGGYDLVCTNSELIDEEGIPTGYSMKNVLKLKKIPIEQDKIFKHLVFTNFVQGSTILARQEFLLDNMPIPNDFGYHDYWFAINASIKRGVHYIDICSVKYRKHLNQVTTNTHETLLQEMTNTPPKKSLMDSCNAHLSDLNVMLKIKNLSQEQILFIQQTKKYYEHMKNKDLYTLKYFVHNYYIIFFDKNIIRKIIRINKRILGLIKHCFYRNFQLAQEDN